MQFDWLNRTSGGYINNIVYLYLTYYNTIVAFSDFISRIDKIKTQWPKEKGQKDKQRFAKHFSHQAKDRVTRIH